VTPRNLCLPPPAGLSITLPPQPGPYRILGIFVDYSPGAAGQYPMTVKSSNAGATRWQTQTAAPLAIDTGVNARTYALIPGASMERSPDDITGAVSATLLTGPLPAHWQDTRDTVTIEVTGGGGAITAVNVLIEDL